MKTIIISGHSDDTITIDGDIGDEASPYDDDQAYLHFDDGTVVQCSYDGLWHVSLVRLGPGASQVAHVAADEANDKDAQLTIKGTFTTYENWSTKDGPTLTELRDVVEREIDLLRVSAMTLEQLKAMHTLLKAVR